MILWSVSCLETPMRILATLTFALLPFVATPMMIHEHVQVTLRKIDPLTGDLKWSYEFSRDRRPYRCEAYPGRIVVFSDSMSQWDDGPNSEVFFLDSRSGR